MSHNDIEDRLAGVLLGTALGDALGIATEGMSARAIARRFGKIDRFRLLGETGFVSDDTEQAALIAQSIARYPDAVDLCVRAFRFALLGWFFRLSWGIGLATIRACLRIAIGLDRSGVPSAGNGAAMRSAVIGAFFCQEPAQRRSFATRLAQVTHTHSLAVEGAFFVAELAGACATHDAVGSRVDLFRSARSVVESTQLGKALDKASDLAGERSPTPVAAQELGNTGYVLHTVPFATFCFLRFGDQTSEALAEAIGAGGDTDTIGAILGGWLGALHGESGLPSELIARIHDGPFGPTHLRALAHCLASTKRGHGRTIPGYSAPMALLRNLALYPVILAHGFRRLFPLLDGSPKRRL